MKPFLVLCIWLCMGGVLAHADEWTSLPKAGERLKKAPSTVSINFEEAVELGFSIFKVYPLDAPPASLSNPTRLRVLASNLVGQVLTLNNDAERRADSGVQTTARTSKSVVIGLRPNLKPGAYVVMWRVLSVDTHISQGHFTFTIDPTDTP